MSCPAIPSYAGAPFDPKKRPGVVAALLAGAWNGIVPAVNPMERGAYSSADLNEMQSRNWAQPHKMGLDHMWSYRLTEAGRTEAAKLALKGAGK